MGLLCIICSLVSLVGLESAFGAVGAKTWALEGFGAGAAISCSVGSAALSPSFFALFVGIFALSSYFVVFFLGFLFLQVWTKKYLI